MRDPLRIKPEEAYTRVKAGSALLVCAYQSDEKYATFKLDGSIAYSAFTGLLPSLPKTQEIIFYCA